MYLSAWNKALDSKSTKLEQIIHNLRPNEKYVDPDFRYNDLNILVGER